MSTATIQVNENNDIFLPDGRNLNILQDAPACAQSVRQAGLMRLGENIYDQLDGVDYLGTIFIGTPDYDAARQSIANAILKVPDVIGIQSLIIDIQGDVLYYNADILTAYGKLTVSN